MNSKYSFVMNKVAVFFRHCYSTVKRKYPTDPDSVKSLPGKIVLGWTIKTNLIFDDFNNKLNLEHCSF